MKGTVQYTWSNYFIPTDENGEFIVQDDKFKEFIEKRKKLLADAIETVLTIEE